jgi:hypothetical protein
MRAEALHYEETSDEISGYWRDHYVWVARDDEDCIWYIRVNHPDGCYLYDGYWSESVGRDGADAIAQAFAGAELLEGE